MAMARSALLSAGIDRPGWQLTSVVGSICEDQSYLLLQ